MRLRVLLLLLTPALLSCRRQVDPQFAAAAEVPENATFTIRVVNNNVLDVALYVVHSSRRERLGDATAKATSTFELRIRRLGAGREFSLLGDPIGGRVPVRTETYLAREGQIVTWTLESDFRRSTVTVF